MWVDPRSKNTHDAYKERLREAQERQLQQAEEQGILVTDLPPIDEEEIWKDVVGGVYHGRVYGMGIQYARRCSTSVTGGASTSRGCTVESEDPRRVEALERRLEEQERRHQEELRKYQEEMRGMEQRMMSSLMSYFTQLHSNNSSGDQLLRQPVPIVPTNPLVSPTDAQEKDDDIDNISGDNDDVGISDDDYM